MIVVFRLAAVLGTARASRHGDVRAIPRTGSPKIIAAVIFRMSNLRKAPPFAIIESGCWGIKSIEESDDAAPGWPDYGFTLGLGNPGPCRANARKPGRSLRGTGGVGPSHPG